MSEATAEAMASSGKSRVDDATFELLERALEAGGPGMALDRLIAELSTAGEYRALLDALLLKARHELGLPLISAGALSELPEPVRTQYEEKYIAAIRLVGSRYLERGDIPNAWPYFRAIAEHDPVAQAIAGYQPAENDERLGAVIDVAFHQGVSPRRGFELILENYGTCPAISAFEQLPPPDEALRIACAERLIRHLHRELTANLRAEIASRGQVLPPEGSSIEALLSGRPWLFADESYHIDISHLAAVVRMSVLVKDPAVIGLAADLTEYGRHLSPRLVFEGTPPFERIFDDHGVYLRALLGRDVDRAIAHFEEKLSRDDGAGDEASLPAQTLVNLLSHVGRVGPAIDVAAAHLAGIPETTLSCPSVSQLCQRAGLHRRLAQIARENGDLVNFTAATIAGMKVGR
jgi:hypothetical protein